MHHDYWHERWNNNNIGFHVENENHILTKNFHQLGLPQNSTIFVPLCGKSLDMTWLMTQGYNVIGCELSPLAIQHFFESLKVIPKSTSVGNITRHQGKGITIFEGDFFELSSHGIGHIDAVYDRAALVALPHEMRHDYTQHLCKITKQAPQFLITYEYQEDIIQGPPFSVSEDEVHKQYAESYCVKLLEIKESKSRKMDNLTVFEKAWLLKNI